MTVFTEGRTPGEYLVFEECRGLSREVVALAAGNALAAGTVLGKVTNGTGAAAAVAGNAGNGTIGAVTVGTGAKAGIYRLTCIHGATDAGRFMVEDPDGINVGVARVGVEFTGGGITFTVADGTVDYAGGDQLTVTVSGASGKFSPLDVAAVDGSHEAAGVLYDNVAAAVVDRQAVITARKAEVSGSALIWPAGITADQKAAAVARLGNLGIIVR